MEIKILHLYYDLLNLYGESGNIRILEKKLKDNGLNVVIDLKTIGDEIDLDAYHFVYMGGGTESKLYRCAKHFATLKDQVEKLINDDRILLATGNSCELLGKSIVSGDGEKIPCAEIFDFETTHNFSARKTGDVICSCPFIEDKIVGFINNCSTVSGLCDPMMIFELGGNGDKGDGARKLNAFATHITGPLLVKNPHFLRYILNILCDMLGVEMAQEDTEDYQYQGYRITLSELMRDR